MWMPMRARSFSPFIGREACTPSYDYPGRRRGQNSSQTTQEVVGAVRMLARICSDDLIAGVLNRNGLQTGRGNRWTRERVTALRSHHEIPCHSPERRSSEG